MTLTNRRTGGCALALCALAGTLLSAAGAAAQEIEVQSAVLPDTVTVGDVFEIHVAVQVPDGVQVRFPNLSDSHPAFQPVEAARVSREPATPAGAVAFRAVYPMTAWQTGTLATPILPVRLALGEAGERTLRIAMPMPFVASVLPADTAGVEPRPAKDILAQPRAFPWWLLLLAAAAIAAGAWLWRRSRRRAEAEAVAALPPRERALRVLDEARRLRLLEPRQWKPFFSLVSEALRGYLAALSPRWAADRTTDELLAALAAEALAAEQLAAIESVLRLADLTKFARYVPSADEADRAWRVAREVVESLESPRAAEAPVLQEVG